MTDGLFGLSNVIPERVIRQGGPVSPYILSFVLNILVYIFILHLLNLDQMLELNLRKIALISRFSCLLIIALSFVGLPKSNKRDYLYS